MTQQSIREGPQLRYVHEFSPEARRRADEYVADFNATHAPAKLSLRALINAALIAYIDARDGEREAA